MKRISPTIISISVLFFFALAFFFPLWFQQKMYTAQDWGRGDLTHFNYPLHHIYGNAVKHFTFPFWTDEIYSGFQLGAEGQVGMFYLPNLMLFSLLPNYTAFALSFVVVSLLSTLGVYWYCRVRNLPHTASVFAAITYGYSMFFAGHFVHLNMVQAFSLIPWFFVLGEYGITKKYTWYAFLLLSLLQVQMFFTGHPQIALYTASILLVYIFLRSPKEKRIRLTVTAVGAIFCGTLMAMVQLLPTWELSKLSPSSELESAENSMYLFPYTLRDLLYFILPSPFGNPANNTYSILLKDGIYWENNTYSGILAFVFFLVIFAKKPDKQLRLLLYLFLTAVIFSMGWLYFFYYIPPYSLFRLPQRALILGIFFLSILSAYGFSFVLQRFKKFGPVSLIAAGIIILLQFFNLWYIGNSYNNPISKEAWLGMPETARYIQSQEGRIYAIGGVKLWEKVYQNVAHGWSGSGGESLIATKGILDPNRNATYGDIPSLDGYAKLVPLRTLAYLSLIRRGVDEESDSITVSSEAAKLLGAGNVKTIITAKPIAGTILKLEKQFTDPHINTTFYLYRNPYYQPFIRSASVLGALPKTGNIEANNLLTGEDWQDTVYGEEQQPTRFFSRNVKISDEQRSPQRIAFSIDAQDSSGLIAISQSFDKNWHALIDGKETKILPLNINSQGLVIPTGHHAVVMRYVPEGFIRGGYISIIGIILTLGICAILATYGVVR